MADRESYGTRFVETEILLAALTLDTVGVIGRVEESTSTERALLRNACELIISVIDNT